jgi:hypothetical protein
MSMEIWVFSDRQLNSIAEWQVAINAEGYPLQLSPDATFEKLRGFVPMRLREERGGCECYHDPADELIAKWSDVDFGHAWKYALGFRWGASFVAMQSAWMAATAYAAVTNGIVIDDQESRIRTAVESRDEVGDIVRSIPKMEEFFARFETSPRQVMTAARLLFFRL